MQTTLQSEIFRRGGSFVVDGAPVVALWIIILRAQPEFPQDADPSRLNSGVVCFTLMFLYQVLMVRARGATLGMIWFGWVVRERDGRVEWVAAALRGAYFAVVYVGIVAIPGSSGALPLLVLAVAGADAALAVLDGRLRAPHDKIFGTLVVDIRRNWPLDDAC